MNLGLKSDGISMTTVARAVADEADSIVFDCDGVLIDVADSYYGAISATVSHMLRVMNMPVAGDVVATSAVTEGFKSLGGFNDEVDLSCAVILGVAAARKTGRRPRDVLEEIIRATGPGGIAEVKDYIAGHLADVSDASAYLEHPHPERNGRLSNIFDQFFFGSDLYEQIRGRPSDIACDGLIDRDRLIIDDRTLRALSGRFGPNISMVTGRGARSAAYTLGPLLPWFDVKNSAFLEDEPRENAKPNPARLDDCILHMSGRSSSIYVGDSVEDLLMSQRSAFNVLFCGITGTSSDPQGRHSLLKARGAHMILDSVLRLPKALNLEAPTSGHDTGR